jgi:hypothetical protein
VNNTNGFANFKIGGDSKLPELVMSTLKFGATMRHGGLNATTMSGMTTLRAAHDPRPPFFMGTNDYQKGLKRKPKQNMINSPISLNSHSQI